MNKVFRYNNLIELQSELATAKNSKIFARRKKSSQNSGFSAEIFTGTKSYDEADNLLKCGDSESAKKIKACNGGKRINNLSYKHRPTTGIIGYAPHIPNYLAGRPNSMIDLKQVAIKQKIATLIINSSVPASVTANELAETAANIVSAARSIEAKGQRLNIYLYLGTNRGDEGAVMLLKIKDSAHALQINKIAYPLVNPSMLRRHFFRFVETRQHLTNTAFTSGYGFPDSQSRAAQLLKSANVKYNSLISIQDLLNKSTEDIINNITGKC